MSSSPQSPSPSGLVVTVQASPQGGGRLIVEWDGTADAPIWMGSDELPTLTVEETLLRDRLCPLLTAKPDPLSDPLPDSEAASVLLPVLGFLLLILFIPLL
jgi:hypothetical protein